MFKILPRQVIDYKLNDMLNILYVWGKKKKTRKRQMVKPVILLP